MAVGNTSKDGLGTWYALLVDSEGRLIMAGPAAEDAAAAGSPLRIGGVYSATPPSVDDGDIVSLLTDDAGRLEIIVSETSGHSATQVTGDANIKASAGVLYGLVVAGAGVTAGDTVALEDGAGGTTILTVVFEAANETIVLPMPHAITFSSAIYANVTLTGGSVYVTGIYD